MRRSCGRVGLLFCPFPFPTKRDEIWGEIIIIYFLTSKTDCQFPVSGSNYE